MTEILDSLGIEFAENEPLSKHSTFRIGGKADVAVYPKSKEELRSVIRLCIDKGIKYAVIGNGSNLLFSDNGYRGAVIFTKKLVGSSIEEKDGYALISAHCGDSLGGISRKAYLEGYSGLEFCFGIPASVGGAVYMNAGAFGSEISCVLVSAQLYDAKADQFRELSAGELDLSYRHSRFMNDDMLICVGATFKVYKGNGEEIKARMDEYKAKRMSSQPYDMASAGSYFKRPEGYYAAKLIDDAGLKGLRVGDAEVSKKHAGFIVNLGEATAEDVLRLAELVKNTIYEKYGVTLESEVRYVEE